MEKTIKDFFADFKDRMTNPFTSSFIIAWLINNFPITVGLLFYKQNDLKLDGYASYLDLIKKHSSWEHMLIWPLVAAFAYTFIFPWFKYCIHWYRAWVEVEDNNRLKSVQQLETITKTKYTELQELYVEKVNLSASLTSEKLLNFDEIAKQKEKILELSKEINQLKRDIDNSNRNNATRTYIAKGTFLFGDWTVKNNGPSNVFDYGEVWKFTEGSVEINNVKYKLEGFTVDAENNKLAFLIPNMVQKDEVKKDVFFAFKIHQSRMMLDQSNKQHGLQLIAEK